MADRKKFNRSSATAPYDQYTVTDHTYDHTYAEAKARDIWSVLTDPPYIKTGGTVTVATNPQQVNASAVQAFDADFIEVNGPVLSNFPVFDTTQGVANYLTVEYLSIEDVGSNRITYTDATKSYNAYIIDSYKYQWKLETAINPEQTGTITESYDIIKDVNDRILFSTDQSNPEYLIQLTQSVASITSDELSSGSVYIQNGVNDNLIFVVDSITYDLDLTAVTQEFTLSGMATQINTLAFVANPSLIYDIAFVIEGENKLRITSPRDGQAVVGKNVTINTGTAESTLGFTAGTTSPESAQKTANEIVNEINLVSSPETTAVAISSKVRVQAESPTGYINIQSIDHSAYSTLGLTTLTTYGAQQIDFSNDIILTRAMADVSGTVTLNTATRTQTITIVDGHEGWKEQFIYTAGSGDVTANPTFELQDHYYIVGSDELMVYKNGIYQHLDESLIEVGATTSRSVHFQVNNVLDNDHIEAVVPASAPSNFPAKIIKNDGDVILMGFTEIDFGPEFTVSTNSSGGVNIRAGQFSGAVMQHGFNHEYGGADKISVNHLNGTLLEPQKTAVYVGGAHLYTRPAFNFTGQGVTVTENASSGYVTINVPEAVLTNVDGDAIFRLGYDGGTVYSSMTIQDSYNNDLWEMTIVNDGQLVTQLLTSGSPTVIILESASGALYQMDVERQFGSGEIKTSLVSSGNPLNFSLEAPNGKAWAVNVMDDGTIYTLDPDNIFEVRNGDGDAIFTVREEGESYISGESFTIASTNLNIADNAIVLNYGETQSGVASGSGGILIDRGAQQSASLVFQESIPGWTMDPGNQQIASQSYVDTVSGVITTAIGPYISNFVAGDWATSGAVYFLDITHNKNRQQVMAQVFSGELFFDTERWIVDENTTRVFAANGFSGSILII